MTVANGLALVVIALVVTGCGGTAAPPKPVAHTLALEITGNGVIGSLTYIVNGARTTERSVHAPWRRSFPIAAGASWELDLHQESGSLTDTAYVDGGVVTTGSSEGDSGESKLSGSIG
jgi:hypothetical protein